MLSDEFDNGRSTTGGRLAEAGNRLGRTAMMFSGFRCAECGAIPPHEEREGFFERGLCGWCCNLAEGDD